MTGLHESSLVELRSVLSSSLNLQEVLGAFYEGLSRQVLRADHAALCVSQPGSAPGYEWVVAQMPETFFARYSEMASEDFVLHSVAKHRNTVLRDSDMLSRTELKKSALYAQCKKLGVRLECVMAVLLDVGLNWHGGLTLYRDSEKQPFTAEDRIFLHCLTPALASTMRNCRLLGKVAGHGPLLEELFHQKDFEVVVLSSPTVEVMRTPRATKLLAQWFHPLECDHAGLPVELLARLVPLNASGGVVAFGQDSLVRERGGRSLVMMLVPLPLQDGRQVWAWIFQEDSIVPEKWRKRLTRQEVKVTEGVLQGWDNQTIAHELRCSVDTVKTHLKHIYAKLGIEGRSKLISSS
jgi:DNA-binding CsgD family transcriptional regulator